MSEKPKNYWDLDYSTVMIYANAKGLKADTADSYDEVAEQFFKEVLPQFTDTEWAVIESENKLLIKMLEPAKPKKCFPKLYKTLFEILEMFKK